MAQNFFLDPVVTAGPNLTGTGNGTLSVDRLTHFTIAQNYTLTCIAKSPDTLFAVVGSLDGSVGIATVGTQFFDQDLKIFLTIQQGSTVFEVGDQFTLSVDNGTDLNQDNIDDYDEYPQKNFGTGTKGTFSGDHNIRYSDDDTFAKLFLQGLKYTAVSAGSVGDDVQVQYFDTVAAIAASNTISGILFTADAPGAAGNSISVEYVDDGTFGLETVSVLSNAITIHIEDGMTTKNNVIAALTASAPASALVDYSIVGSGTDLVITTVATFLTGGADAIGDFGNESVQVVGDLIKVYFASGLSTALSIKTAIEASIPASAKVTVSLISDGDDVQFAPVAFQNLSGGESRYFSLNKRELTESGDFFEGNASAQLNDAQLSGSLKVAGDSEFSKVVALDDQTAENNSGPNISNVQKYINNLIQDEKITLRTSDHSKLQWSKPNLSFEADIVIDFTDSDISNKINVSDSPISIADGESLYVFLDRDNTRYLSTFVDSQLPNLVNVFRVASRFGDNLIMWDNTLIRDGKSVRIGEGGEGGTVRVDLYDPVSTTLPSGTGATLDGVALTNGMLVLFSNLSSGNNRVYKVSGVGVSLSWSAQSSFSTGFDPVTGDDVLVNYGDAFGIQRGIFDGSDFKFNDFTRFFNGTDYWELSSLQTAALSASTTDNIFTIALVGSENIIVDFSIIRGSVKQVGTLHITSDGSSVSVTETGAYIGATGITFAADISMGDLRLRYAAGSGSSATMKFFVRRWSDSPGGPGNVPSYTVIPPTVPGAAGSDTEIQYNSSGSFAGDPNFTWDSAGKTLSLSGLKIVGLQGPSVLLDNTASPTTIFQYTASVYPFVIIEYSLKRDTVYEVGRLLLVNDGSNTSLTRDFAILGTSGITFTADVSGGNVRLRYTSNSTGFNAQFKYSIRQWS